MTGKVAIIISGVFTAVVVALAIVAAVSDSGVAHYRVTCPAPEALVIEAMQAKPVDGMLRVQDLSGRWWTLPPTCTAAPIVGPDR